MKLKNCIEKIQSSVGGGVFTAENITEVKFVESILSTTRSTCIKEMYPTRNNIHEIYYQSVDLIYEEDLQESDCYTLFRYPVVLNINSQVDGHQYLGAFKGDNSWKRVKSFAHYENWKKALGKRIKSDHLYYVLEPASGLVRVYHNSTGVRPKRATGYSVFADPLDPIIQFNRQEDEYPITPECMDLVEQYLRQGKFEKYLRGPSNVVANGADDNNAAVQAA